MTDYFDDYDDTFDGDDFGDDGEDFMDDSFEDTFDENFEPEDLTDDSTEIEDDQSDGICEDEFTANEALIFGVGMGFAYEEGLIEAKRRKLQRELDKENDGRLLDD